MTLGLACSAGGGDGAHGREMGSMRGALVPLFIADRLVRKKKSEWQVFWPQRFGGIAPRNFKEL